MSWTYDPTDLDTATGTGRLNVVRLLVGDTDTTDPQVQDEEVSFALSENNNNVYYSGSWVSRIIAAKYSRLVSTELNGALRSDYSDLARQYKTLSEDLEYQGKTSGAAVGVLAGGITKSTVGSVRENTNRIEGSFRRDQST